MNETVPLSELIEKMDIWFSGDRRKLLLAVAVVVLFLLSPHGGLAAHGESIWWHHSSDFATALQVPAGSITGYVWYDDNGDRVRDEVEGGMGEVTLDLYRDDGDGIIGPDDEWLDTQTTLADGAYHFTDLARGDYIVDVTDTYGVLADYVLTTANDPLGIRLRTGEDYRGANFGYEGVAMPTAVALSSFAARSGTGAAAVWRWAGLAGLTALTVGGTIWRRRQRP